MNDPYKWITDFFSKREPRSPMRLEYIIPKVYERYFILHSNYGIIDEFPFDNYPEGSFSTEELYKRYEIEKYYVRLLRNSYDVESLYKPISLKELAVRFNTKYSADMMDNIKASPGITPMMGKTFENIGRFIQSIQLQGPLCLYVNDYYRFQFDDYYRIHFGNPDDQDKKVKEKSEIELPGYFYFQNMSGFDSCSYLFQKGHPWCLATFEDFEHFLFSCDTVTADQLTSEEGIEYFEIS